MPPMLIFDAVRELKDVVMGLDGWSSKSQVDRVAVTEYGVCMRREEVFARDIPKDLRAQAMGRHIT